jgi:hypothetical protein
MSRNSILELNKVTGLKLQYYSKINCTVRKKLLEKKVKVKLSLQQAVEAHRVVTHRDSHII